MALRNRTCLVGLLLAALVAPQVAAQGPASRGDSAAKDKTLPPQPGTGAGCTVQIQPIIPPDRDRWSVGIGLDLVTLFFPDRSDASKSTTAAQSR